MLTIFVMMVLAVSTGLFTGAIIFSAWKAARFGRRVDLAEQIAAQWLPW